MRARNLPLQLRAPVWFNRLLKMTLGVYLRWRFRLQAVALEHIRNTQPPFLLLPNHVGFWDPFLISIFIRQPVHFVAADANFRSPIMRLLLGLVGAVPITKGVSDLDTVRRLLRIRDAGGVIGLFGEGGRTWDGATLPMASGTAKLAKLLKIPVVCPVFRGGYLSHPRWARVPRRGRMYVAFQAPIQPAELRARSAPELQHRIETLLAHDDVRWARETGVTFRSARPAEYAEHPLFLCPRCRRYGTLQSDHRRLGCSACGFAAGLDGQGRLRPDAPAGTTEPRLDSVRAWHLWQEARVSEHARRAVHGAHGDLSGTNLAENAESKPLLRDQEIVCRSGFRAERMIRCGTGSLALWPDRLRFEAPERPARLELPIVEMQGVNIQMQRTLELYCGETLYTFEPRSPRCSMYKWERFILALQQAHRERAPRTPPQ